MMSKLFGWFDRFMEILDGQPQVEIPEEQTTLIELNEKEWLAVRNFIMRAELSCCELNELVLRKDLLRFKFGSFKPAKRYK